MEELDEKSEPSQTGGVSAELRKLIEKHRLRFEQAQEELGRLAGEYGQFELYPEQAVIEFSDGAQVRLRARAQMIGSFSTADGAWQWGWANTSAAINLIAATLALRDADDAAAVPELGQSSFTCTEAEAWGIAGAAHALMNAHSVYRVPENSTWWFLALYEPSENVSDYPTSSSAVDVSDGESEEEPIRDAQRRSPKQKAATQQPSAKSPRGKASSAKSKTATAKSKTATAKSKTATGKSKTATGKSKTATAKSKTATAKSKTATGKSKTATAKSKTATAKTKTKTATSKKARDTTARGKATTPKRRSPARPTARRR